MRRAMYIAVNVLRPAVKDTTKGEKDFRWRSPNVSRIENFADIIFALVLALIGAHEVPKSMTELFGMWRSLMATGICFATVFMIWNAHYTFFRRYDMLDGWTVFLNSCLLFIVFAFAYPLKFVMGFVIAYFTGAFANDAATQAVMTLPQARWVVVLYSAGYALVFWVFAALYRHALADAAD
ncbi:MAG: TMEM175 family protein, partial [Myxococcota bacterium]